MAQRPHVPKFGGWDGQNVPYTMCFDNARKGRGAGERILSPKDAEGMRELGEERRREPPGNIRSPLISQAPSLADASDMIDIHDAQQIRQEKKHRSKGDGAFASHTKSPYHDHAYNREKPGAQRSRDNKNRATGYGGYGGNYAGSPPANYYRSPERSSDSGGRGYNPRSPSPRQAATKTNHKINPPAEARTKVASVPKFGAWDVASPQAEAGFTVIFNKVKEERHKLANNLPVFTTTPAYSPPREIRGKKPRRSRMSCCFWPADS